MKKILALVLALVMVLALAACGSKTEAPAAEEPAAPAADAPAAPAAPAAGEVTWADYQEYLIEKAGANAPDLDEFKGQVYAINSWDELDQTVSPWDQMFTTIGLSTWDEFQAGVVKEPAVMGGPDPAASGEPTDEAAAEEPAAEAGEASGEASGPSGEQLDQQFDCDVVVDGQTVTAHYEDTDNGDQATKGFVITVGDKVIEGAIDKGVWTAASGDAADQAIVEQVQAAFEAGNTVGPQA